MTERPPQLAPQRLAAVLILPLGLYVLLRVLTGSATEALALTEVIPAGWLVIMGIVHRRIDPIGALATVSVAIALAVYALTGGDPIALKLRHGVVTGAMGIAALTSLALGRPLLLVIAQRSAAVDPQHRTQIEAKLAEPDRRRALVLLTALIGAVLTLDGIVQVVLAFTVSTGAFVFDSTAAHVVVLGGGAAAVIWYIRYQKEQRHGAPFS